MASVLRLVALLCGGPAHLHPCSSQVCLSLHLFPAKLCITSVKPCSTDARTIPCLRNTQTHKHACAPARARTHTHTHTHVRPHRVCVRVCVCDIGQYHTHTHTHTDTRTHTHIFFLSRASRLPSAERSSLVERKNITLPIDLSRTDREERRRVKLKRQVWRQK